VSKHAQIAAISTVKLRAHKNRAGSGGRGESEIIPALLNAPKKISHPPCINIHNYNNSTVICKNKIFLKNSSNFIEHVD
jgi:hypothetical protein